MTKDNRFEKAYQDNMKGKGEKMCEVLDRIEQQGIKKGLKKGIKQGIKQGMEKGIRKGENRFASLIRHLNADHREAEIQKAAADRQYREQLYQEYHL